MRIICFVNNNSGPSYHRCILPLMLMKNVDVYITNNLLVEDFEKGCDILMYNRTLPDHAMELIHDLKRKHGFKICVDIDDYWQLEENHILYQLYQDEMFAGQQVDHIKNADIVLTTHSRLAGEISAFNKNVHVCANAIPKQGQFDIEREPSYLTRLFWQGSITHGEDIMLLRTPIDRLASIAGKVKMIMGGYNEEEPEWRAMAHIYTAGGKHQYKLAGGFHVAEYYQLYKEADICLVPLVNNKFNRMKSNLKVLEAANLGLPVIASNVHPYIGMPLLFCKHSGDWVKHITRLVASKKRRREAGAELAEYCEEHFNFHRINAERKQILEYEASKITAL